MFHLSSELSLKWLWVLFSQEAEAKILTGKGVPWFLGAALALSSACYDLIRSSLESYRVSRHLHFDGQQVPFSQWYITIASLKYFTSRGRPQPKSLFCLVSASGVGKGALFFTFSSILVLILLPSKEWKTEKTSPFWQGIELGSLARKASVVITTPLHLFQCHVFAIHEFRITVCHGRSEKSCGGE